MVRLTIDGRETWVEDGMTVLEAARSLGVRIPTLCYVKDFPAAASCFLCAVEIAGRGTLQPSCALPAAEGMAVSTESSEVRASRKMALELLLSDHVGDCVGPCRTGCPAHLDIPGFISCLTSGDFRRSAEIVGDYLTLPASLGRICPRLCELRCRQNDTGEPLTVASLHRFSADRDLDSGDPYVPHREKPSGRRVGIVGAGPAGLAAAYHLLRRGHDAVVFDAHQEPGGMLRWGIPAFRLPRTILEQEISAIRRLGGRFRMGERLGRDFAFEDLRRDFDAVFLAIGAQQSRGLGCAGEDLAVSAIDLLRDVAAGHIPQVGGAVIVLGGGNTAVDAARTAVRLGAGSVAIFYRRTRREMPCLMSEVEAAEAEGVRVETLVAPVRLEQNGGQIRLTCIRMVMGEPDASGRARPIPVPDSEFGVTAGSVVSAIGQAVDLEALRGSGLTFTPMGIEVDASTLATSLEGVFAGGDGVTGADLAVRAVAAGKLAAVSISQFLEGRTVRGDPEMVTVLMGRLTEEETAELFREIEASPHARMPEMPIEERIRSFDEVELGLPADVVLRESGRCIGCGCWKSTTCQLRQYATEYGADPLRFEGARRRFRRDGSHPEIIYEPGKCILCGACVAAAAQAGERLGLAIVGRGFEATVAVPLRGTLAEGMPFAARRAAEVCPTGAIALKDSHNGGCPMA